MRQTPLVLGLLTFALAVVGGAAGQPRTTAIAPPPARFRPAVGWTVSQPSRKEQPSLYRSMTVAVTADDTAAVEPFAPFQGFKRLSARGIIVWETTIARSGTLPGFTHLSWPLQLSTFRVDRGWEGQPSPNIQQRLRSGTAAGWDLEVRIYFGTQHPDKKLLDKAQAELTRLRPPATR